MSTCSASHGRGPIHLAPTPLPPPHQGAPASPESPRPTDEKLLWLEQLIEQSSLGSPGARELRERIDPDLARRLSTIDRRVSPSMVDSLRTSWGPTVMRIGVGRQLRSLRKLAGVTREQASEKIRASTAKISRLELGKVSFKERDVADLLSLYGVHDDAERTEILDLVRQANEPGWWQHHADLLPNWFEIYLGLEQAASVIRTFELQFVPGLLQTRAYARAVIGLVCPHGEEVERRVELLMRRQQLLSSPDAPTLWAVIEEAALHRSIGDPELARDQLDRLLEMNEWPNISIQIAPLRGGGYPAAGGAFTLLRFAQTDLPDIVYLEQLTGALYLDKPTEVDHYARVMNALVSRLEPPSHTAAILSRIRSSL